MSKAKPAIATSPSSDNPARNAADLISQIINARPQSPSAAEIEAVIASTVPVASRDVSPLGLQVREAIADCNAAIRQWAAAAPGADIDAAAEVAKAAEKRLGDLTKRLPVQSIVPGDIITRAEIAWHHCELDQSGKMAGLDPVANGVGGDEQTKAELILSVLQFAGLAEHYRHANAAPIGPIPAYSMSFQVRKAAEEVSALLDAKPLRILPSIGRIEEVINAALCPPSKTDHTAEARLEVAETVARIRAIDADLMSVNGEYDAGGIVEAQEAELEGLMPKLGDLADEIAASGDVSFASIATMAQAAWVHDGLANHDKGEVTRQLVVMNLKAAGCSKCFGLEG